MGGVGSTELLILLVIVVAAGLVVVRSRVTASRNRQARGAQPVRGIAAGSGAPPIVVATPRSGSIEARLLELDSLRTRGVIGEDEYVAARKAALEGGQSFA